MVTLQGTSPICHLNVDVDAARLTLQSRRDGGSGLTYSTYGGEWFDTDYYGGERFRSECIVRGVVRFISRYTAPTCIRCVGALHVVRRCSLL